MTLRVGASLGGGGGGGGGAYVPLDGSVPMIGPLQVPGVVLEEYLVDIPNDLTHHISLYLWYGFSVSAFRLNYVSNGRHVFLFQDIDLFTIEQAGVTSNVPVTLPGDPTQPLEAATKQYVDNAVAPLLARIAELEAAAR